ncbi:organic solute transporter subunit alpha-like [Microcaecilia unicolor]|uniref:Organic solute transporter subunit alpha-like n=1 Tax=Microcaecilia unicolor TaxID=1415580 RepID=A0A6P7XJP7_9AMPH|nr:organic solute transporter subunit alpha-like [Microcaecilia unicolor]
MDNMAGYKTTFHEEWDKILSTVTEHNMPGDSTAVVWSRELHWVRNHSCPSPAQKALKTCITNEGSVEAEQITDLIMSEHEQKLKGACCRALPIINGAAIWINCFIDIITVIALWPVVIMFTQVKVLLSCKKIIPKFALYQFIVILSQLQTVIINILAISGTIACAPPLAASSRASYMSQQLIIMEMFLITLLSRVFYRKCYDELEHPETADQEAKDNTQNTKISLNGKEGPQNI